MTASRCRPGRCSTSVLERAADPDEWERFERQLRSTGYCRRPVRLRGRVDSIDATTGEVVASYSTEREPDGTLLKCCGNRREAVCPSCARTYRGDAFQLVASGMRGGKGVPETVAEHPLVFLTLTAPSFGPVHSRRVVDGKARRCRPRRDGETCPHGVSLACGEVHDEDDPRLGEPICARVLRLRARGAVERARARAVAADARSSSRASSRGCSASSRSELPRARVLRQGRRVPAPRRAALPLRPAPRRRRRGRRARGAGARARHAAADRRRARGRRGTCRSSPPPPTTDGRLPGLAPAPAREIRWGAQVEVRELDTRGSAEEAASCAGYIAKYATKSTEAVGGLMYRLERRDVDASRCARTSRRYVECAWRLGGYRHLHALRLRRWAHQLGFRGHCFTKSRRYSTTFTRAAPGAPRARAQARGGERRDRGPPDQRGRVREQRAGYGGYRLPDAGRRVARRVRPQARGRAAAGRARGASHRAGATTIDEGRLR